MKTFSIKLSHGGKTIRVCGRARKRRHAVKAAKRLMHRAGEKWKTEGAGVKDEPEAPAFKLLFASKRRPAFLGKKIQPTAALSFKELDELLRASASGQLRKPSTPKK